MRTRGTDPSCGLPNEFKVKLLLKDNTEYQAEPNNMGWRDKGRAVRSLHSTVHDMEIERTARRAAVENARFLAEWKAKHEGSG
jgi:hypothetical protein